MSRMDCPTSDTLSAFLLGDLPETQLSEVAAHVSGCAACEEQACLLDSASDEIVECLRRLPNCDLEVPLADTEHSSSSEMPAFPAATENWGEFRVVREIGRGGMGVVYEAYQGSLNRHVALKLLPESGDAARFRREAKAAGRLHHTNIVPVYGVGEQQGRHFYVMQYIAGRGLERVLKDRAAESSGPARLGEREAARIGVQVAEALAYAHGQGVIHRDVKPSNLLLDQQGTVWVTDFGLAHDDSDTMTLTHTGDFVGTLRYVAPERIAGHGDARADLYGLGITLYELVCGRPAYARADRAVLVHQVLNQDPPAPRQLVPEIARDMETIVLKAMARDPAQRYATAEALADDLRRFLDDRTILARPSGPLRRLVRWCRRKPSAAAAIGVTVAAAIAVTTLSATMAFLQGHAARALRGEQSKTQAVLIRTEEIAAGLALERGLMLCEQGDPARGLLWMARSLQLAPAQAAGLDHTIRLNLDAWSRQVPPIHCVLQEPRVVAAQAFGPDGRTILVITTYGTARRYDADSGELVDELFRHPGPVCAAFSADARIAVTVTLAAGDYKVWDCLTGKPIGPLVAGAGRAVTCSLSPDGKMLVIHGSKNTLHVLDLKSGRALARPMAHPATIAPIAWSPDNRSILTGCTDRGARLWDARTGALVGEPLVHDHGVSAVAFAPDGEAFATGSSDGTVRIWIRAHPRLSEPKLRLPAEVRSIRFSPDGRWLAIGSVDDMARIWDTRTQALLGCPLQHRRPVNGITFHPRRALFLTRGDHEDKAWQLSGESAPRLVKRTRETLPIRAVTLSAGVDKLLISGGRARPPAGQTRLCSLTGHGDPGPVLRQTFEVYAAVSSPDGRNAVTGSGMVAPDRTTELGELCRFDLATGELLGPPVRVAAIVMSVALSPDGRLILAGCSDGKARLFDAGTGLPLARPLEHKGRVRAVAFSGDGRRVVAACSDQTAQVWDLAAARPIGPLIATAARWFPSHSAPMETSWQPAAWTAPHGSGISPAAASLAARCAIATNHQPWRSVATDRCS